MKARGWQRFNRWFSLLFVMGLLAACVNGVVAPATAEQLSSNRDRGGELIVGLESDIIALDPAFSYDPSTSPVVNEISEGLLKFKNGETLEPNLAESWENPDPTTYIYHIRQDVTFHDGTPMTIDDVIFSMERTRNPETVSYLGWMYDSVNAIEKVDDRTIKVTLKQPDALWQYVVATSAGHVISKAYYEAHIDSFGTPEGGLLGTGPFKFVSWTPGSEIVLEKYADYWDKANGGPYLDQITFKIPTEGTTPVAGLESGELSAVLGIIPADQVPVLQKMQDIELQPTDSFLTEMIVFNTQRPPFDNVKVRQALNYAVDKVLFTETHYGDAATVARGTDVMPRLWTFEKELWTAAYESLPTYERDLEKAKQLLAESGMAEELNGKVITTVESPVPLAQAVALQEAAKDLGVELTIRQLDFEEYTAVHYDGVRDYDLLVTAWGSDFPDAVGNLLPVFHSRNVGDGGTNFGNYQNAEVDKLLDEQNALIDNAERTALMIQAQKIIADDSVWIVFDHPKQFFALNKDFTGYEITPLWLWDAFAKNIHQK
jgi:peptide/nickel transport system substrate-binding protein